MGASRAPRWRWHPVVPLWSRLWGFSWGSERPHCRMPFQVPVGRGSPPHHPVHPLQPPTLKRAPAQISHQLFGVNRGREREREEAERGALSPQHTSESLFSEMKAHRGTSYDQPRTSSAPPFVASMFFLLSLLHRVLFFPPLSFSLIRKSLA